MKIDYSDYKRMIWKRAGYWHKRSGVDINELIAEGNLAFAVAIDEYDPDKGAFSTLLWLKMEDRIGNFAKWQGARRSVGYGPLNSEIYTEYYVTHTATPDMVFRFKALIESLSDEAKEVIKTILNCPDELLGMARRKKTVKITKKIIRDHLEQTMPILEIDMAFAEITEALRC